MIVRFWNERNVCMITIGFAETSGSCAHHAFCQPRGYETTEGRVRQKISDANKLKRTAQILRDIEKIESKPSEERTMEDKLKLAGFYGKAFIDKLSESCLTYMA